MSAKYLMDTLKAREGVDFTKYALSAIGQYVGRELAKLNTIIML